MKKIAIVGLGKIGLFHLSVLRNTPGAEIVGLVDEKPDAQKTVKGMGIPIPFFKDVEALLQENRPDGVFVCVPPAFSRAVAAPCLRRGAGVFVEKPMAASLEDAREMVKELGPASPPSNAVGYMVAYYPTFQKAKELLGSASVGRVKHYESSLLLGEVFKRQEGWRQDPKISGGGAVAVVGSHMLFLIQWLLGLPESLRSTSVQIFSEVEDSAQANFRHGDFEGTFYTSWSRPGYGELGFQITVEGTQGFLDVTESRVALHAFEGNPKFSPGWHSWDLWDLEEKKSDQKIQIGQQGYQSQDRDFVESLGSGRPLRASWAEGLKVQRMIEGIYRAAQAPGQDIPLPQ